MIVSILICALLFQSISTTSYTCDPTASCGCTVSTVSTSARIVGGEQAPDGAWGWMLSLQYRGNHICGATLIEPGFAFTSAHCLSSNVVTLRNYSVVAGTNYLNDTSAKVQRRSLVAVYINPSYNYSFFASDVAMIRFEPFTVGSSASVSLICVGNQGENVFSVGENLVAIGWGVESYGSAVVPNALRQVTVQAMDANSTDCRNVNLRDPTGRFCAGISDTGGKDTCQGDSGGPLMSFYNNRWYLAGVPTSGQGCARAGYPGIYTRISKYVSYIQNVLNNPDNPTISLISVNSATAENSSTSSPSSIGSSETTTSNSSTSSPSSTESSETTTSKPSTSSPSSTGSSETTTSKSSTSESTTVSASNISTTSASSPSSRNGLFTVTSSIICLVITLVGISWMSE